MRTLQSTMTWIVSFMSSAVKIAKTAISFNVFYELVISIYVYVTQANFTREKSMTFEIAKKVCYICMLTRSAYSRVWKGIVGIRDLTEIQSGIREDAKFLDGIRDLTATREAGWAKVVAWDAVLGKKRKENVIRDIDDKSSGCRRGNAGSGPLSDPHISRISDGLLKRSMLSN